MIIHRAAADRVFACDRDSPIGKPAKAPTKRRGTAGLSSA